MSDTSALINFMTKTTRSCQAHKIFHQPFYLPWPVWVRSSRIKGLVGINLARRDNLHCLFCVILTQNVAPLWDTSRSTSLSTIFWTISPNPDPWYVAPAVQTFIIFELVTSGTNVFVPCDAIPLVNLSTITYNPSICRTTWYRVKLIHVTNVVRSWLPPIITTCGLVISKFSQRTRAWGSMSRGIRH